MKLINKQADLYLDKILSNIKEVLGVKAKDYVRNEDRLHNFNQGSEKTGEIRERIMRKFRLKHDISVDDILDDIEKGNLPSKEKVYEKYGDIINYNILEMISILQRIDKKSISEGIDKYSMKKLEPFYHTKFEDGTYLTKEDINKKLHLLGHMSIDKMNITYPEVDIWEEIKIK